MYHIRKAGLDDDFNKISKLMFDGFRIYRYDEVNMEKRELTIYSYAALMKKKYNEYSYKNIWLYIVDDKIAGMLLGYKLDKIDAKKSLKEIKSVRIFPHLKHKYKEYRKSLKPLTDKTSSAFLLVVSVDEMYRNQGIGKKLTDYFCDYCKNELKCTKVYTDVKLECKHEIELLEKDGFQPSRAIERETIDENIMCVRMDKYLN